MVNLGYLLYFQGNLPPGRLNPSKIVKDRVSEKAKVLMRKISSLLVMITSFRPWRKLMNTNAHVKEFAFKLATLLDHIRNGGNFETQIWREKLEEMRQLLDRDFRTDDELYVPVEDSNFRTPVSFIFKRR